MMGRIMIVDDERDVVSLLRFLLEKDGHEILEAYNGVEALEKIGVEPRDGTRPRPDLIVTDVMMPLMDGCAMGERLAADPAARSIPLIVLTAKGDGDPPPLSRNVAATLEKPFEPKRLRDLVNAVLERRR